MTITKREEPPEEPRCWACGAGAEECRDPKKCEDDARRMWEAYADELAAEEEEGRRNEKETT